jgi:AcrR family transcriptional regulator/transposase-like protein
MDGEPTDRRRLSPTERRAIQESRESVAALARRLGLNPKTIRRWRGRATTEARRPGPQAAASSRLPPETEVAVLMLRSLARLPLDDCHFVAGRLDPGLSRAAVYRCLRRSGFPRLVHAPSADAEAGVFRLHRLRLAPEIYLVAAVEPASRSMRAAVSGDWREALEAFAAQGVLAAAFGAPAEVSRADLRRACREVGVKLLPARPEPAGASLGKAEAALQTAFARLGRPAFDLALSRLLSVYDQDCRLKVLGGATPAARFAATSGPLDRSRAGAARRTTPAARRQTLLEAARAVLARSGPEGLSVSGVARAAGVSRAHAYQHFASRAELIAATATWSSAQLRDAVFAPPSAAQSPNDVADVANGLARFAIENPEVCRAWLFQVLSSPDPSADVFWREYCERARRFHETPMAAPGIDAEVLSVIILAGSFLWPIWARAKAHDATDLPAFSERFGRELLRLAMYGTVRREYFADHAEVGGRA